MIRPLKHRSDFESLTESVYALFGLERQVPIVLILRALASLIKSSEVYEPSRHLL